MFTGEGLGASRDNFSTNLARLKNLRQRFVQQRRAADDMESWLEQETRTGVPDWMHGIDLHWLVRKDRDWLASEHNTTLEMMFIYLVSMLDVFFGQWGVEHEVFDDDERWPPAIPEEIRKAVCPLLPAVERQLIEYRARRDALVHKGGVADTRYCTKVGDTSMLGQRLPVTEVYLDGAVEFIDYLVAATAVTKYNGPPRHEAKELWPELKRRVFVA